MNYQEKRPDLSVFALSIILVLGLVSVFGGEGWQTANGCVVIGGGSWASWKIGRWAWWRFGPRVSLDFTR
jgi:hypothetical protein